MVSTWIFALVVGFGNCCGLRVYIHVGFSLVVRVGLRVGSSSWFWFWHSWCPCVGLRCDVRIGLQCGLRFGLRLGIRFGRRFGIGIGLRCGIRLGLRLGPRLGLRLGIYFGLGVLSQTSRHVESYD